MKLNNHRILKLKKASIAILSSSIIFINGYAAPGPLSPAPLFLSQNVEPNIVFDMDDSASMEFEMMLPSGVGVLDGRLSINGYDYAYIFPYNGNSYGFDQALPDTIKTAPSNNLINSMWRLKNTDYNSIYYNPQVTYTEWKGIDARGNPFFQPADPLNAIIDIYNPSFGVVNLTSSVNMRVTIQSPQNVNTTLSNDRFFPAEYYEWTDTNANGKVDILDVHSLVIITPANLTYSSGRTYAEELQNFANWFQYHRKRKYAAINAFSSTLQNISFARVGYHGFNQGFFQNVLSMSQPLNKARILNTLYSTVIPTRVANPLLRATPARASYQQVGDYFRSNNGPILSAAAGGECQQNFGIILTDGFWSGDAIGVSPIGIGNEDGDNNSSFDGGAFADSNAPTLADVAMYYYENDLKPNLADNVPVIAGIDNATHQHLVTHTISFGVDGLLDPLIDDPLSPTFRWPNPFPYGSAVARQARIDDLWHAAYNGRGSFSNLRDPNALTKSLNATIQGIRKLSTSSTAASFNATSLNTNTVLYKAIFDSSDWSGDLKAFPIVNINTGSLALTELWSSQTQLDNRNLLSNPRQILTYNGLNGTPFNWLNLTALQQQSLATTNTGAITTNAEAQARLQFIRGDRSNEGAGYNFRVRGSRQGDIVHSNPVYVGAPNLRWPDTAPFPIGMNAYSNFKASSNRNSMLYFGANDGMLHGLDAATGNEVFSYIPSSMFSTLPNKGLHNLIDKNYSHQYYVDAEPSVSDIFIRSTNSGLQWRTVLASGLRGGGKGIFALDITAPSTITESNAASSVLWEFTNLDDTDLGFTYSQPIIGLSNSGRWIAVFGNGYNNSGSGEAALFILDIEKGIDGNWLVSDYKKITTGAGNPINKNGLSSPALADIDGNGTIDRVYAGDLQGNLWAFDLSSQTESNWGLDYAGSPLFRTQNNQAITSKPILASHPKLSGSASKPNLMVFFGTGQFLSLPDPQIVAPQSFYGISDTGSANLSVNNLVQQTFINSSNPNNRILTQNIVNYSTENGWYFDLPDTGERVITSPLVRGNEVLFNSFVPLTAACTSGGYGFRFAVDLTNGGRSRAPAIDSNNDGIVDSSDLYNSMSVVAIRQDGFLSRPVTIDDLSFTGDVPLKIKKLSDVRTGRLSWQEHVQ